MNQVLDFNAGQNLKGFRLHFRSVVNVWDSWRIETNNFYVCIVFWTVWHCFTFSNNTWIKNSIGAVAEARFATVIRITSNVWSPNSTGSFGDLVTQEGYTSLGTAQGSFYTRPGGYGDLIRVVNGSFDYISPPSGYDGIGFDLSRNSSIFSGNKLQSSALQVLPCIRTWCTVMLARQMAVTLYRRTQKILVRDQS